MLKAPVLIETASGIKNLRQLTVSEAVYFCESFYQSGRIDLLQDLDDSQASPEVRFEQLRTFSKQKGMASYLIQQVFNVKNAKELILHVSDGNKEWVEEVPSHELVDIALRCMGHEEEEEDEPVGKLEAATK